MRNVTIAGAFCILVGAGVIAYFAEGGDHTCPANGRILSDDEMVASALRGVAVDLNLMRSNLAERVETSEVSLELDAAQILSMQPDCCGWTRDYASEWRERIENGRIADGHSAFRGAMRVALEDPRILGPHFESLDLTIALDVCGDVIVPRAR